MKLTSRQRLDLAKISGIGQRRALGPDRDRGLEEALAELREVTRDPMILGLALGSALAVAEAQEWQQPLVDLYRAAGADEQVAAEHRDLQRERFRRYGNI
jgi:hypothetical protein